MDPDVRNKREVYDHIAGFLSERLSRSAPECLAATHSVCAESDERLLGASRLASVDLLDEVRELLLVVKVHYRVEDARRCRRTLEIWFSEGQDPAVHKAETTLQWDDLPAEVRSDKLREGANRVSFKLYPVEA